MGVYFHGAAHDQEALWSIFLLPGGVGTPAVRSAYLNYTPSDNQ